MAAKLNEERFAMSNKKLLKWAAKHVTEWPEGYDELTATEAGEVFWSCDAGKYYGIKATKAFKTTQIVTREEWEAARASRAGKVSRCELLQLLSGIQAECLEILAGLQPLDLMDMAKRITSTTGSGPTYSHSETIARDETGPAPAGGAAMLEVELLVRHIATLHAFCIMSGPPPPHAPHDGRPHTLSFLNLPEALRDRISAATKELTDAK